jgi:hypothetical protein
MKTTTTILLGLGAFGAFLALRPKTAAASAPSTTTVTAKSGLFDPNQVLAIALPAPAGFRSFFTPGTGQNTGRVIVTVDNMGPGGASGQAPFQPVGFSKAFDPLAVSADGNTVVVRWTSSDDPRIPIADGSVILATRGGG